MTSTRETNKRIARNTLMLYGRMLLLMGIALYTSRVVLDALGVVDYGVSNVVGGIVTMFSFINMAMSSATQRYVTFALGQADLARLRRVFGTSLQIHALIAILVVVLGEALGLWFLYHKMQVPPGRLNAAFWVLHCSVANAAIAVASVPYSALIVAHERMSAFAYFSIVEGVLKLAVACLLVWLPMDKLILYSLLLLGVQVLVRLCYTSYCSRHFPESRHLRGCDRALLAEMSSFAGWNLVGNLAAVLFTQGLNMLLNVFFGPAVNAARGVAVQVQGAVQQFVSNFQMALNPQITKTYARGDMQAMHALMFRSARFSYFLLLMLALPVLLETPFVLSVWLKQVPQHTVSFLRIMLCTSLIYTLSNPLMVASQATGSIRRYQAVCGGILLLILPVSYVCLRMGCSARAVFVVHFVMESVTQGVRMLLLRPHLGLRLRDYLAHIYLQVLGVTALSCMLPGALHSVMQSGVLRFLAVGVACVAVVPASAYAVGLTAGERCVVNGRLLQLRDKMLMRC